MLRKELEWLRPGLWINTPDGWDVIDTVMLTREGTRVACESGREYEVDTGEDEEVDVL